MIRTVLGVILGYVVMFLVLFVVLTALYLSLGVDRTFEASSYNVTTLWLSLMFISNFVAALVGGKVCRVLSGRRWALIPLVVVVLAGGLIAAVPAVIAAPSSEVRTGDVSNLQAIVKAREPKWFSVVMPFVCAVGVLAGGRSKKK